MATATVKPSIGRIIHFKSIPNEGEESHIVPGIVNIVDGDDVGAHLFDPVLRTAAHSNTLLGEKLIPYSEGGEPGTWSWPGKA